MIFYFFDDYYLLFHKQFIMLQILRQNRKRILINLESTCLMSKYEREKQKGFMKLVAQRIAQKIDNQPNIRNISQRWVWQLIQNAKDANNQFDKVKIQMELYDDRFVFKHNGCPFTESNIQSLIFHYSSKDDENKEEAQTTGKYGTGFMVTYIISKKVRLNCMLKISPDESVSVKQEDISCSLQQENEKTRILIDNISTKKADLKQKKIQAKKTASLDYHQKLSLLMDYSEPSVEKLIEKLGILDCDLRQQLQEKQKNFQYVRDEYSTDTEFVYEELNQASFNDISFGLSSVKKLFPLTLLFNDKLHSIKFTNHSKKIPQQSFQIIRQKQNNIKVNGFNIFSAAIYQYDDYDQRLNDSKVIVQYLYERYKSINGIVAFPVRIQDNKINLLILEENFPKIFKQFPLIGCEDTGFNFAFTSKDLYPAQNRCELYLKDCQGRTTPKVESNWNIMSKLFTQLKHTYILLARKIAKGKINLFRFSANNFLSRTYFKQQRKDLLKQKIASIKDSLCKLKIFTSMNNDQLLEFSNIQIVYDRSIRSEARVKAYKLFSFLYQRHITLQQFEQIHQFLSLGQSNNSIRMSENFRSIKMSLDILAGLKFNNFLSKFQSQSDALAHINQIYEFLHANCVEQLKNFAPIIVNQNLNFRSYYQSPTNKIIQVCVEDDFSGKQQLFRIADRLGIKYKSLLIHKSVEDVFKKYQQSRLQNKDKQMKEISDPHLPYFKKIDIIRMIVDHVLLSNTQDRKLQVQMLIIAGRLLSSFQRATTETCNIAKNFKKFMIIQQSNQNEKISIEAENEKNQVEKLQKYFDANFYTEAVKMYNQSRTMNEFAQNFIGQSKMRAFWQIKQFLRYNDEKKLNMTHFVNQLQEIIKCQPKQLRSLQDYNILTGVDYKLYDKLSFQYQAANKFNPPRPIGKILVHRQFAHDSAFLKKFQEITYEGLFYWVKLYYNSIKISKQDKQQILNYTFEIYNEYIRKGNRRYKQKHDSFSDIINARHLQFGKLLNELNNDDKDLICQIFRMKENFKSLRELIDNFSIEEALAILYKNQRDNE